MRKALRFAGLCLVRPSAAARESGSGAAIGLGAFLYLAALLLKPWSMPPSSAATPAVSASAWAEIAFWDVALTGLGFLWLASFLSYFKEARPGTYSLKLLAAMLASAVAGGVLVGGWRHGGAAVCLLCLLVAAPARRFPGARWRSLVGFMLGLNVIALATFPIEWASGLWLEKAWLMTAVLGGLWMLVAAGIGLREIAGIRLARAFLALIFLNIWQAAAIFAFYRLGLISKAVVAVLFYA